MRETKTLWAEGDDAGSPALSRRSRVFLVAENGDRATALKAALAVAGCKIVGHAGAEEEFAQRLPNLSADIVVSYMPTPSRDTLATMSAVTRHYPVPIVMFVDSSDDATTEAAVRAGVSAYVIDGLAGRRIRPILDLATARFNESQALLGELEKTKAGLAERKTVERAKGILMREKRLSEDEAYHLLRKLAMDQNKRLFEIAHGLVTYSEILKR